jgi:hypothetical protein
MRRPRTFPLEEILLAQLAPGFLFAIGWTAMYEIYHEEGSYFTTLIQEILGSEGLFPYFLILAILMSLPVGMMVDAIRHVVGEVWLGLPRTISGERPLPAFPETLGRGNASVGEIEQRDSLYRRARTTLLTPATAAGNLGLVVLILTVWSTVKIFYMGGLHVFSPVFVIGTPLIGLGLVLVLLVRYVTGLSQFHREVYGSVPAMEKPAPAISAAEVSVFPSDPRHMPVSPTPPEGP